MASATTSPTLAVSQALKLANAALGTMPQIKVIGEVSGFRGANARSGHCYFSIKDDQAAMDCIVWKSTYAASHVQLRDGLQIELTGSFNIYEASGRMSFIARKLAVAGEGALRQQIAELAEKLRREGLMDDSRKRAIPRFCEHIAVVTSLSGSVIDDVKRTLARRNPLVSLSVVGCAVQGTHAPATIVRALQVAAASSPRPDCILLVRGGGSLEDLMAFNDEAVARAVAACPIPVVTGIGHEPDTSICDMVADRRTSTPTAAAESVAPALEEVVSAINDRQARLVLKTSNILRECTDFAERTQKDLSHALVGRLDREHQKLDALADRRCMREPQSLIVDKSERLELTAQRLSDALPHLMGSSERNLVQLSERISRAIPSVLSRKQRELDTDISRMRGIGLRFLNTYRAQVDRDEASLRALSPLQVLSRGYSITRDAQGHVISSIAEVSPGDELLITVSDGTIETKAHATKATNQE